MANTIVTQRDTQLEKQRVGLSMLTITNFINDDEPAIASGSVVEISGSLYSFTANEAITGWAGMSDGLVWIKLVPDGTNPCTAEFTDTAPTWNDAKQGWYDGTGTDRYVARLEKAGASGYTRKLLMKDKVRGDAIIDGDISVGGNGEIDGKITAENGELVISHTSTFGSWNVAASTTMVVPAGIYMVQAFNDTMTVVLWTGSAWQGHAAVGVRAEARSMIMSDGVNVGIQNGSSANPGTVYYRKFV